MKYDTNNVEAFTPHTVWTATVIYVTHDEPGMVCGHSIFADRGDGFCTRRALFQDGKGMSTLLIPDINNYNRYIKGQPVYNVYRDSDMKKN